MGRCAARLYYPLARRCGRPPGRRRLIASQVWCRVCVESFISFARVSFLRRKTNITQAPCQDREGIYGGLHTAAEMIQNPQNRRITASTTRRGPPYANARDGPQRAAIATAGPFPSPCLCLRHSRLDVRIKARLKAHIFTHVFILRNEPRQYFTLRWGICSIHDSSGIFWEK